MKTKAIVNSKGEPQAARVEIPLEGKGGDLGIQAVRNLVALIEGLKKMQAAEDVIAHWYIISGYGVCCQDCGFLTEKSLNDLMQAAEFLVDNELARVTKEQE